MEALQLAPGWYIPAHDLVARFVRSSGPGGQNVNKVSTKVELRFALASTHSLSDAQKDRLRALVPHAVAQSGEFILVCDTTRSQITNLQQVRERLRDLVLQIRRAPKARLATRPTRAARARRMDDKRKRSDVKSQRRRIDH